MLGNNCRRSLPVKLDRVIFCWDGHPQFIGMWELVSAAWNRLGVESTIFLSGGMRWGLSAIKNLSGDTRRLVPPGGSGQWRDWQTTMALLWGACQFPGETVMTSGLDQFPLSRRFQTALADEPDDAVVVGFAGARSYTDHGTAFGCRYYPSAYVAARSDLWRRVIQPQEDFADFVRWATTTGWQAMWMAGRDLWGMDEAVLSHRIKEAQSANGRVRSWLRLRLFSTEFFDDWRSRRVERGDPRVTDYDLDLLRQEYFSEMHLNRPLTDSDRQFAEAFLALPEVM